MLLSRRSTLGSLVALSACASPGAPRAQSARPGADPEQLSLRISGELERRREDLIGFRRTIHQHPELSGEEIATSAALAAQFTALGFNVRTGVAGHGIVAHLQGARPGPVFAFRAEMDAIRSNDPDPVAFASVTPGVRHICGHDIHATISLALAHGFSSIRNDFAGTLLLVLQPAEEIGTGAAAMVADGALDQPRAEAIFAFHCSPMEIGTIGTREGRLMAALDRLYVTITPGGAGAEAIAAALQERFRTLSTIAFRGQLGVTHDDSVLVRFGPLHTTPEGQTKQLVVFALGLERERQRVRESTTRAIEELSREHADFHIDSTYVADAVPGALNDPALTRRVVQSVRATIGDDATIVFPELGAIYSDDFGHMQARTPGVMMFLGASNTARGWIATPHAPNFVADEEAIFVGARTMARIMLDYAAEGPST